MAALVMLVVAIRSKSSAVSVSSVPTPAGWDNAPSRPSGFPVLKKKDSAQAGVARATVAAMKLSSKGVASARAHVCQLAVVRDRDRFIRVSSWVRGCRKSARAARLTALLVVVISVVAGDVRVEDVVGRVGHERLGADVCRRAGRQRCHSSRGVHALDESGRRQRVATGRSVLGARHLKQEPRNGTDRDETRIHGRGTEEPGPDGARVPRVLPRGANRSMLEWVGAEEVGDDLPVCVAEQGGIGCEEEPGESGGVGTHARWGARVRARQADVVLGADGVPLEERLVSHRHLKFVGHAWWCDPVGVGELRRRDGAGHGKRCCAHHAQDARRGLMLGCTADLHLFMTSFDRDAWLYRAGVPVAWRPPWKMRSKRGGRETYRPRKVLS